MNNKLIYEVLFFLLSQVTPRMQGDHYELDRLQDLLIKEINKK